MLSWVHELTTTTEIVTMAAGAFAIVSLRANIALGIRLRQIRADHRTVL